MKTLKMKLLRGLAMTAVGMMAAVPLAASAAQPYTFALLLSTLNNPYFVAMKDSAQAEANRLGIKLLVLDGNNSSTTQTNQVRTAIARKVDMLLINPTDATAMSPSVEEANRAGVPVIFLDRRTDKGKALDFFASDNVDAGTTACDFIAKKLGGKGDMAILLGVPGASATNERTQGCEAALKAYPGIKVVAKQTANFNRQQGLDVMRNILIAHPTGLLAVFAENDEMALGAVQALHAANRATGITIASIDGTPDGIAAVKKGDIALDVAQQPALMSKLGVMAGYEYLHSGVPFVAVPLQLHVAGK
ncbi:MAG: D-ribose ABC transporter substrate-binding protein [Thiomonas sp.]|nr:D-ribose ABC transporter substrate-binding protein [Thiomonas sp.]